MSASFFVRTMLVASVLSSAAQAQPASTPPAEAPAPLVVYFGIGSATIRAQDQAVLDRASRAFNEGHPIVMSINGATDRVGSASSNLLLSQQRANAVLHGLVARGIPADRFQLVAKGTTEPAVSTPEGVPEERNRRVEITWR